MKEELISVIYNLFLIVEEGGTLPNSFCEPTFPISKSDEDSTEKENCRPISLRT